MRKVVPVTAALLLAACAAVPPPADAPAPPANPPAAVAARQGGMAMLPVLDAEAGPTANMFYSPASIEQAFGLVRLGAQGETAAQLDAVLPAPREPLGLASKGDGVEVRLANALWLSDEYRFRPSYVASAERDYGATAERLDFGQPAAVAGTINAWAAKATEGLISQVVTPDSVTPDAVAFLTNALYFDGLWATPFNGAGDQPFLFGDGSERSFRLMHEVLTVPMASAEGLTAVRLPYRDRRYVMDVIIPDRRMVMTAAPDPATIAALADKLGTSAPMLVDVRLPQFEIEYRKGLIPALQAIGLTLPFDKAQADLSAMAEPGQQRLSIDDVQHVAKLQVFDTGTRAAAVTSVRVVVTSARMYETPPVPFVVDRPFVVVLRDLQRGEVLFLGRIAEPAAFTPEVRE